LKTFLDSGVLLHAWRGESLSAAALKLMDDDTRRFCSSQMTRLELLLKPIFEKRKTEIEFYNAHFADCESVLPLSEALGKEAEKLASRYGLAGRDALQLAAAIQQGAEEFYTSEKPNKPMFRVREIKVISLFSIS
jgi:predicted nucleic acid-binding protein